MQRNEIVRAAWNAYAAGDLEEALQYFGPDIVWYPAADHPGPAPHRGHDGLRLWVQDIATRFSTYVMTLTEVVELNEEVVAHGLLYAEAEGETVIDRATTWRCVVRDGLIRSVVAEPTGPADRHSGTSRATEAPAIDAPAIACPRCGQWVSLSHGIGSVGTRVFTCPSCGYTFGPGTAP